MVDALASGASTGNGVEVRVLSWAPWSSEKLQEASISGFFCTLSPKTAIQNASQETPRSLWHSCASNGCRMASGQGSSISVVSQTIRSPSHQQ